MEYDEEIRNKALEAIVADRYSFNKNAYAEFAFFLIDKNIESENIYILAGLDNSSYEDKMHYFDLVLTELGLIIDKNVDFDFIYAKSIAYQVISGIMEPIIGIRLLGKHYLSSNNRLYFEFLEISDAIDLLDEGHELVQGMRKENIEEYIKHNFELFLEFFDLVLPEHFYKQAYCKKCLLRIIPEQKKERKGFFGEKYIIQYCPYCKSKEFYWTRYNDGKDLYLKEIRLTTV